ncbi:hypothetical protein OH805_05580 [Streptomyces sp. NBC_00879]|uniref:hypothetical protein n=1 Tax=Streptomyces sp. NBC_00879 TaxID=2975855 RepID=UPI00386D315E|nr:hypothetical protein OH805_05580 [Streptomyces sp. NBC_00879]
MTSSSRVRSRTAARTWVESVRCVVRSRTRPASFRRAGARSRRRSARSPSANWRTLTKLRTDPARATQLLRALLVLTNLEVHR